MRVNKAKCKLLKWEKYDAHCRKIAFGSIYELQSVANSRYHDGHAKAFWNYSNANRYVPVGIRTVYRAKWMVT